MIRFSIALVIFLIPLVRIDAQETVIPAVDDFVEHNVSDGGKTNLEALVRLLQREHGMQIYFDPNAFPRENELVFFGDVKLKSGEQFFQFVQLVLRNSGFAIVESELQGMHQIVPLANVRPFVPRRDGDADISDLENGEYVTAVFSLQHISPDAAERYLKHFVLQSVDMQGNTANTSTDGVILKLPPNLIIVTEMASRISRVKHAIDTVDIPQEEIQTEFRTVVNLEAKALEEQLNAIKQQQDKVRDNLGDSDSGVSQVSTGLQNLRNLQISSDERTNRLILIGTRAAIAEIDKLIKELDQGLEMEVATIKFENIGAARVDAMIRQSLPNDPEKLARFYQATINESNNSLVVTARADILLRIEEIKSQLDIPGSSFQGSSPVEFYKLKHVKAVEVLDTLQRVIRQSQPESGQFQSGLSERGINTATGIRSRPGIPPNGLNSPDRNIDGQFQEQQFLRTDINDPVRGRDLLRRAAADEFSPFSNSLTDILEGALLETGNVLPGDAQVTVDENTNTLIVVAKPEVQELYRELIEKLDVYRPQVLVEVIVVALDAQEDFNLGVEVSAGDRSGPKRLFSFTSFGLSEVDPTNGALSITPGLGFNGTLVDPDVADVVLRALSRHRRAKVISAPRILVNDNATGLLSSVAEVPFQSINASNTVATTSFAGFATAGTTVSVTPQISEGDYLNLEFDVLVNDFTGAGNEALPPPRNTDQVTSQVTIPNGNTVIVGGLTRQRNSIDEQRIPFIEDVPVLEFMTGNTSEGAREQRLFVFIKPTILKDDKFKDLRYLSEVEHREACIPGDFPESSPLLIR